MAVLEQKWQDLESQWQTIELVSVPVLAVPVLKQQQQIPVVLLKPGW